MAEHLVQIHDDGPCYSQQLQSLMERRREHDHALGLIVRDHHFPRLQHLLWDDADHGHGIRVRSADRMAERWFRKDILRRRQMRKDAEEFIALASTSAGRKVWLQGEVVDVMWQRGRRRSALDLEMEWRDFLADGDVGLVCGYKQDPSLQRSTLGDMTLHSHDNGADWMQASA